jgi:hypothetical protein
MRGGFTIICLLNEIQGEISNHVTLVNETGIKIGDIYEAIEYVKGKIDRIMRTLWSDSWRTVIQESSWEVFKEERVLILACKGQCEETETAAECVDEEQASDSKVEGEDEEKKGNEDEDESEDETISDCDNEDEPTDLWNDFRFKLFIPIDFEKELSGV